MEKSAGKPERQFTYLEVVLNSVYCCPNTLADTTQYKMNNNNNPRAQNTVARGGKASIAIFALLWLMISSMRS